MDTVLIIVKLFLAWCVLSVPVTLVVAYCMRSVDRAAPPVPERADTAAATAPRPRYANG